MGAPQLTNFQDGVTQLNAGMANTFVQSCDTFSDLRSFAGGGVLQVYCRGQNADDDGGQGTFWWSSTLSSPVDDDWNTIVPNGSTQGAWIRVSSDGLPQSVFINGAYQASVSDNGKIITGLGNIVLPKSSTVGSKFSFIASARYNNIIDLSLLSGSGDNINGTITGTDVFAIGSGLTCVVTTDGNGTWFASTVQYSVDNVTIEANLAVLSLTPGARQFQRQIITSPGATTWTTPSNITSSTAFKFTLVGGGGGGGGASNTANFVGGPGQAGYLVRVNTSGLSASTAYSITIGAAGVGGSSGANGGTAGGTTSIVLPAPTGSIVAAGGAAGAAGSSTAVKIADNGSDIPGDVDFDTWGAVGFTPIGSGGGIQFGGSSAYGRGGYTSLASGAAAGTNGQGYGAGGSGGYAGAGSNEPGGNGTQGMMLIEWIGV